MFVLVIASIVLLVVGFVWGRYYENRRLRKVSKSVSDVMYAAGYRQGRIEAAQRGWFTTPN